MSCKKCKCKVCSCIKNEVPKIAVNGIVQNQNENDVVNIKVPTKTSQLINDSGFGQGNGGGTGGQKIEDIRVNGELVPIINKEAIMNVPTKTSNLINDSNFVTKPYVDTHIVNKANPHNVTKEQVGLGNVDNTSDLSKPISTATQLALDSKIPTTDVKSEIIYEDLKPINSKAVEKYAVKKIHTIADLRNTKGEYEGQIVSLLGYYEAGDKESLNYKWTSTQGVDDGGSVINSGSGSWEALFENNTIKVTDFGLFETTGDDTLILNNILGLSENKTLVFPEGKDYYINGTEKGEVISGGYGGILIPSNVIIDLNKSNLNVIPTISGQYSVIRILNKSNIVIKNGEITGDRDSHLGNGGEWGYGIKIEGGSNIIIDNVRISSMWGDGIYLGVYKNAQNETIITKSVKMINNHIEYCRRQGISVIGVEDFLSENNTIRNIYGTSPQSAMDFEPNIAATEYYRDVRIINNNIEGCQQGILMGIAVTGGYIGNNKNVLIKGNIFKNTLEFEMGRAIAVTCDEVIVDSNIAMNCNTFIHTRFGKNVSISNNIIHTTNFSSIDPLRGRTLDVATNENIVFSNNICYNYNALYQVNIYGSADTVHIIDNKFYNPVNYCIMLMNTPSVKKNIFIKGNTFIGSNPKNDDTAKASDSSYIYNRSESKVEGLFIESNTFIPKGELKQMYCFVSGNLGTPTSLVFRNNFMKDASTTAVRQSSFTIENLNLKADFKLVDGNILENGAILSEKYSNYGSPEGVVYGVKGCIYSDLTNGDTYKKTSLYTLNTGWIKMISSAVSDVTTANATDLATALTLVNELKAKLNSKLTADRNSGQQAT